MGQANGKQQESKKFQKKVQNDLQELQLSPNLKKLKKLYEEIIQYDAKEYSIILDKIETMHKNILEETRNKSRKKENSENQKYIQQIEKSEDKIELVNIKMERYGGTQYEDYINILEEENKILSKLEPNSSDNINKYRLDTIRNICIRIEEIYQIITKHNQQSKPVITDNEKKDNLKGLARRVKQLEQQIQDGSKLDDYKLMEQINSMLTELGKMSSHVVTSTEELFRETNKKVQDMWVKINKNIPNNSKIMPELLPIIDDKCEKLEIRMRTFSGSKLDDEYYDLDNEITDLMTRVDNIPSKNNIEVKNKRKSIMNRLNELSDQYDEICANAPATLSDQERKDKLDQFNKLSDDLETTNLMIHKYSGNKDEHTKLDNRLLELFKDGNRIDDKKDAEVEEAKKGYLSDVQESMLLLSKKHEEVTFKH